MDAEGAVGVQIMPPATVRAEPRAQAEGTVGGRDLRRLRRDVQRGADDGLRRHGRGFPAGIGGGVVDPHRDPVGQDEAQGRALPAEDLVEPPAGRVQGPADRGEEGGPAGHFEAEVAVRLAVGRVDGDATAAGQGVDAPLGVEAQGARAEQVE